MSHVERNPLTEFSLYLRLNKYVEHYNTGFPDKRIFCILEITSMVKGKQSLTRDTLVILTNIVQLCVSDLFSSLFEWN